jgi:RNA polymerase sigma-70 factor (ECF subfamily)
LDSNIVSVKDGDVMLDSDVDSRFNEIYDLTNKSVLAFITARCGNTADIGDIFQDTYMELYRQLAKHGAGHVKEGKPYVFRIAKRRIAQHYSLLKRLQMFVSMTVIEKNDDRENSVIEISNADISDIDSFLSEDNPEDYVVNQTMLDNIRQLINDKPNDIRQIFYFYYEAELSISEISQALSLSESNVKNKLYRTLKELQNLLN